MLISKTFAVLVEPVTKPCSVVTSDQPFLTSAHKDWGYGRPLRRPCGDGGGGGGGWGGVGA